MARFWELEPGFVNLDHVRWIVPFPNGFGAALYFAEDELSGEGNPIMGDDWHRLREMLRKNFPDTANRAVLDENHRPY